MAELPTEGRPHWAVRTALWAPLVFTIVPVLSLAFLLLPLVVTTGPRPVPGNACALIPANLLARVVPAAADDMEADAHNAEQFTNRGSCSVHTDLDRVPTAVRGLLHVAVERNGDLGGRDPADHAQDNFAGSKRFQLLDTIVPHRVVDLRRLGDSAYASIDVRDGARQDRDPSVEVDVLAGDTVLSVRYSASPSTDELTLSAAVAVARALLGVLR